jgi:sugar/nucleoside kinase (ribokinase family)
VIVKCGSQGSVASDGKRIVRCAARQVTVADAVGAGDTFNAGFLLALRAGHDLEACMECGTAVASYYIARSHDRFPTLSDLNPELVSSPAATERNA